MTVLVSLLVASRDPGGAISTVAGQYTANAVFLGHSYVKYQSYVDKVPVLAYNMQNTYMVNYWFTNVGRIDGTGAIVNPQTELASVVAFLNAVNGYEAANAASFSVLAWLKITCLA